VLRYDAGVELIGACWQAHSCVEKAGMISLVKMRELEIDNDFSLRGPTLQKAIEVCSRLDVMLVVHSSAVRQVIFQL